ncbi:hypothetical protein Tco_0122513 [Tanacetum coccineum]
MTGSDLLLKLLHKLGLNESFNSTVSSTVARNSSQPTNINQVAYHASSLLGPAYYTSPPYVGPTAAAPSYLSAQKLASPLVPPGFYYTAHSLPAQQPIAAHFVSNGNTKMASAPPAQTADALGQATPLPHAFTTGTLHDLSAWNMDTEKPPVLCHACQLSKHARLPFVSSSTVISSCFDIIHSDV